jgi:transposase InsO family protein
MPEQAYFRQVNTPFFLGLHRGELHEQEQLNVIPSLYACEEMRCGCGGSRRRTGTAARLTAAPAGLVHHSDRGVRYAGLAYRQRLAQAGVIPSMSRRGNCYDNAMMESFWSTLKRELVHGCLAIFEWIETFYNRTRFHSALGYQSLVDFETQLN